MKTQEKRKPAYERGQYNIKNRVETEIIVECTNDFKRQFKEFCKENHTSMADYIRQLIVEDSYEKIISECDKLLFNNTKGNA
jgi:hypothetical protein